MFSILILASTKKSCVALKTVVSTKKIFHIEVNVAQQNYMSHKKICCGNNKNYVTPKEKRLMLTKMFSVEQKRNTSLQKVVLVAYKYMSN